MSTRSAGNHREEFTVQIRTRTSGLLRCAGVVAAILAATTPAYSQFPAEDEERDPQPRVGPIDVPLTPPPRETPDEPEIVRFTGRIVRLEADQLTLETNDTDENLTHTISPDAEVFLNKDPAELRDLRPGDFVRLRIVAGESPQVTRVWAAREKEHPDQPDQTLPPAAFRATPDELREEAARSGIAAANIPLPPVAGEPRQGGFPFFGGGFFGGVIGGDQAGGLGVVVTDASTDGIHPTASGIVTAPGNVDAAGNVDGVNTVTGNSEIQANTTDTFGVAGEGFRGDPGVVGSDTTSGLNSPTASDVGGGVALQPGTGRGALILQVRAGTPAEQVGLRRGDVIVALDNLPISGGVELVERIVQFQPGATVTLTINPADEQQPNPGTPVPDANPVGPLAGSPSAVSRTPPTSAAPQASADTSARQPGGITAATDQPGTTLPTGAQPQRGIDFLPQPNGDDSGDLQTVAVTLTTQQVANDVAVPRGDDLTQQLFTGDGQTEQQILQALQQLSRELQALRQEIFQVHGQQGPIPTRTGPQPTPTGPQSPTPIPSEPQPFPMTTPPGSLPSNAQPGTPRAAPDRGAGRPAQPTPSGATRPSRPRNQGTPQPAPPGPSGSSSSSAAAGSGQAR